MPKRLRDLMYQQGGKYTDELALAHSPVTDGYLPKRMLPEHLVRTVCGYCSTGCSLDVHIKQGEPVNLTATRDYPVNKGEACPKGWEALTPLGAADRAATPYLRNAEGKLEPVDWQTALLAFTDNLTRIQETYGKESVAFLSTGQIATEEMALLGALAKFGMGMVHGDGNTRQCMATAVVAYKESFGFDAPPYTYQDFEESDVLVFIGANPCIAHPIMWERVLQNKNKPQILVIDPRLTETGMAASRHYPIEPKSDLVLFYALTHLFIERGWMDSKFIKTHTEGFEELKRHVSDYSIERASRVTGLSIGKIKGLAEIIRNGKRVSFWWTMGVNQSYQGVRTAQAIINLALITGNIGRPGTGANSITGQCNAMGSRLFSNTTSLFAGRDFRDPIHRNEVASILEINEKRIPQKNSWAYDQIIEGIISGKIKGLWVIATNPAHSWIHHTELRKYLDNLEFLVVQDMYHTTETAQRADLIFPAAAWGEKDGTFINSERRIGRIRKVSRAPGQALSDFYIFRLVAEFWGCGRLFESWKTPEAVFEILKALSKGTPCDISGIRDYAMLDTHGGIQWPLPEGAQPVTERRLFEDGQFFHEDGRARLIVSEEQACPEPVDADYPLILLTGRGTSAQWHTQTRTAKSAMLRKLYPRDAYIEINAEDAKIRGIRQGDSIFVSTRRGTVKAQAVVMVTIKPGQLFMPMHYEETNRLTLLSFDPFSRQPSYKMCAAQVSRERVLGL